MNFLEQISKLLKIEKEEGRLVSLLFLYSLIITLCLLCKVCCSQESEDQVTEATSHHEKAETDSETGGD